MDQAEQARAEGDAGHDLAHHRRLADAAGEGADDLGDDPDEDQAGEQAGERGVGGGAGEEHVSYDVASGEAVRDPSAGSHDGRSLRGGRSPCGSPGGL